MAVETTDTVSKKIFLENSCVISNMHRFGYSSGVRGMKTDLFLQKKLSDKLKNPKPQKDSLQLWS